MWRRQASRGARQVSTVPPSGCAATAKLPCAARGAVREVGQALAALGWGVRHPDAVVDDLHDDVGADVDVDVHPRRVGVAGDVGDRLAHDGCEVLGDRAGHREVERAATRGSRSSRRVARAGPPRAP